MIPWDNIDTVLLDMDGTLLDLHFDNYFWFQHLPKRYAEHHHVTLQQAEIDIREHIDRLRGTLNWYCLDHWSNLLNVDVGELKHELRHKIQVRPYAEEFLQVLKSLKKKLILITNAHPIGLQLKLKVTRIDQWLDVIISSHELGSPKEEQAFWQELLKVEHFNKDRCVFIDDTPNILQSAQRFGIKHLVCVSAPDSQKPANASSDFFDILHFNEIVPVQ